jgi:hypothetical protein
MVNGLSEHGPGFLWWKMMERSEHRSKPLKLARDVSCVDGFGEISQTISIQFLDTFEGSVIWILIR